MNMKVFASILRLKEVGSQSAVGIRLSLKEVGIYTDYQSRIKAKTEIAGCSPFKRLLDFGLPLS